jgi:hypothetical protein
MFNWRYPSLVMIAALTLSAHAAVAGTKVLVSLVPNSATDPPTPPTMSETKGKLLGTDKGVVKVSLSGVTTDGVTFVTTSTAFNDAVKACTTPPCAIVLDGSEYVVIIKVSVPAAGFDAEFIVPVDLKKGNGKTKVSASSVISLIPSGAGRSLEVKGAEVWGPVGGDGTTCADVMNALILGSGIDTTLDDPACRGANGGVKIGVAGLNAP